MQKPIWNLSIVVISIILMNSCGNNSNSTKVQKIKDTSFKIWAKDSHVVYIYHVYGKDTEVTSDIPQDWISSEK